MKDSYQIIRECLKQTNERGRKKFQQELSQEKNIINRFRLFLFTHPNFIFLVILALYLVIMIAAPIINNFFADALIVKLLLFILYLVGYLSITTSLLIITPKFNMNWNERWSRTSGCFLNKTQLDLVGAKRKIKRDILSYERKSEFWKFTIKFLWGGIIVGAVASDIDFQNALLDVSLSKMYEYNIFATLCIIILPFIFYYYVVKYDIPMACMRNVLLQIDIEFENI